MDWGWSYFYGVLTAATVAVAAVSWRHDRERLRGLIVGSIALALTYVGTNLSFLGLGTRHMISYPVMDTMAAALLAVLWLHTRAPWAAVIFGLLCLEIIEHVLYLRISPQDRLATYSYDLALNVIYSLQLSCVAVTAFASILRRRGRNIAT